MLNYSNRQWFCKAPNSSMVTSFCYQHFFACFLCDFYLYSFYSFQSLVLVHTFRSSRTKLRFGVLQFLKTQDAETLTMLLQTRVFPMYAMRLPPPYVLANSNWLLGELAASLPEVTAKSIFFHWQ